MNIYCDESGGIPAGVMTLAAVAIPAEGADGLLRRFRAVSGLRGELKGSRIGLTERALFFELFERFGGRALVGEAHRDALPPPAPGERDRDLRVYAALLEDVIGALLPETGGCAQVVIDDGRYDQATLALVRADIAALVGPCGAARLEDSRRSSGVQIADVVANSLYNLSTPGPRADRIATILDPFLAAGLVRRRPLAADRISRAAPSPATAG